MPAAIFVDGNWLLHRATSVSSKAAYAQPDKRISNLVLGWFCTYALKFQAEHGALLFDGDSNFRYSIYPEYKANRKGSRGSETPHELDLDEDPVYKNLPTVVALFNALHIPVFQNDLYEADDLMAAGATHWSSQSTLNKSIIVCRDKDLLGSVTKQISVFTPEVYNQPEKIYTPDTLPIHKGLGLSPKQFADYQILVGDEIDNIPSIAKPKFSKETLLRHGSLKKWFSTIEGKEFFEAHSTELIRNQQLVRMQSECWGPEENQLKFQFSPTADSLVSLKFGALPSAYVSLRSFCSPKNALFK